MRTYNIHDAKTNLSKLIEQALNGEAFVIARAGKPLVKVMAIDAPSESEQRRFDFMPGAQVPDDFNTMGASEISALFSQ
jgi:antitoxin (DNA-binding transcriptional repressor) of toxin-antitoxin stability system